MKIICLVLFYQIIALPVNDGLLAGLKGIFKSAQPAAEEVSKVPAKKLGMKATLKGKFGKLLNQGEKTAPSAAVESASGTGKLKAFKQKAFNLLRKEPKPEQAANLPAEEPISKVDALMQRWKKFRGKDKSTNQAAVSKPAGVANQAKPVADVPAAVSHLTMPKVNEISVVSEPAAVANPVTDVPAAVSHPTMPKVNEISVVSEPAAAAKQAKSEAAVSPLTPPKSEPNSPVQGSTSEFGTRPGSESEIKPIINPHPTTSNLDKSAIAAKPKKQPPQVPDRSSVEYNFFFPELATTQSGLKHQKVSLSFFSRHGFTKGYESDVKARLALLDKLIAEKEAQKTWLNLFHRTFLGYEI